MMGDVVYYDEVVGFVDCYLFVVKVVKLGDCIVILMGDLIQEWLLINFLCLYYVC